MIGIVVYIGVFLSTFFVGSFAVFRWYGENPTSPPIFLLLIGTALMWPIIVPLTVAILLLINIAKLAMMIAEEIKDK